MALHERISVNSACFQGAGWPQLAEAWKALGATRVSFIGMLLESDPAGAKAVLQSGEYRLETTVHPFMLGHQLDADDAVLAAEQEKLSRTIDAVAALGGRSVFIATGGRGCYTWEEAAAVFCSAIAPCVAHAARAGVELAIENTPPVYAHLNIVHSLRETMELAEMAGVGICLDIFSCWTEAGLRETMERAIPRCPVVQIADYVYGDRALPARAVPGDGAIPIRRLLDWMLSAGYRGGFDLELMGPRIDAEGHLAATRRAADNLGEMLVSLGV